MDVYGGCSGQKNQRSRASAPTIIVFDYVFRLVKAGDSASTVVLFFKTPFLVTAPDLQDPAEMEHQLWPATQQQRAGGKDDVSHKKLPFIIMLGDMF